MKCLNEFFIDCLISYDVDLKQWTICSKLKYVINWTKPIKDSTLETQGVWRILGMHVPVICRPKR